jgi:hypothetical protein
MEKDVIINPKGRCISSKHLEAYKKGVLKYLLEVIKEDPQLSLEMRLGNQAIVYFQKKKLLTTKLDTKGNITVTPLSSGYYKGKEGPSINMKEVANFRSKGKVQKYFREAKRFVLYKKGEEFTFQQNIAVGNHSFDNKYLVVDMEWAFSQEEESDRIDRTRPDLVIVDTEKNTNGNNDIYLAELKVGTGAAHGDSGIIDHVNSTFEIIQKKEACAALINDVSSIIANKVELGLIEGQPKEFCFADKPKMMIISAYRGEEEKRELDELAQNACNVAIEKGMEEPKCLLLNAFITLND